MLCLLVPKENEQGGVSPPSSIDFNQNDGGESNRALFFVKSYFTAGENWEVCFNGLNDIFLGVF